MYFHNQKLILRPWEESDAQSLFRYASDPDVGPIAGWPPHQSVEQSLDVIRHVFNGDECYAICKRNSHEAIGAIELKLNGHTDMTERDDECELGYWLAKPYWGQGYMTEALRAMVQYGFERKGLDVLAIGHFKENSRSRRVIEKCGFHYEGTCPRLFSALTARSLTMCAIPSCGRIIFLSGAVQNP